MVQKTSHMIQKRHCFVGIMKTDNGMSNQPLHTKLYLQVWDTPSIGMKMPFATPGPSRRPSEAGSHAPGSEAGIPDHPWGLVLGQFATVARHDPRPEVLLHPPIFLPVSFRILTDMLWVIVALYVHLTPYAVIQN